MYNDLQESLNLNVKMLNLNVNFWVSGGSRMIYKKVVHSNLNLLVFGVSMYIDSQESLKMLKC